MQTAVVPYLPYLDLFHSVLIFSSSPLPPPPPPHHPHPAVGIADAEIKTLSAEDSVRAIKGSVDQNVAFRAAPTAWNFALLSRYFSGHSTSFSQLSVRFPVSLGPHNQ